MMCYCDEEVVFIFVEYMLCAIAVGLSTALATVWFLTREKK